MGRLVGLGCKTYINVNTFYQENYWTGISFRYEDALCFLVGFQVANNLTLAYAFDLITSKLSDPITTRSGCIKSFIATPSFKNSGLETI